MLVRSLPRGNNGSRSELSFGRQFEEVRERADYWCFPTLLDWSQKAALEAYKSGALTEDGYDFLTRQIFNAGRRGRDELLYLCYSMMLGSEGLSMSRGLYK